MFERGDSFSRILKIYVSDKAEIFFGFFFQKRREVSAAAVALLMLRHFVSKCPRVREILMDFRFSDEFNPNLRYSYRESPVLERNFKVEVRSQKRPKLLLNRLLLPDDIHQYDQFHKRIVASLWPRLIILWIPSWKQIYQFNLFKNTLSGREHNYLKSDGIKRHWVVKICIDTVVFKQWWSIEIKVNTFMLVINLCERASDPATANIDAACKINRGSPEQERILINQTQVPWARTNVN